MASIVEICNMALGNIHAKSINSLTEASKEAQNCKLRWPYVRDAVLRDAPWNFARKELNLALTTHEPKEWSYAYSYPTDCLKARYIPPGYINRGDTSDGMTFRHRVDQQLVSPPPPVPFAIGLMGASDDKVIMTDEPEAKLVYTVRIEDPNLYDATFFFLAAHYLAAQIAIPIVGGERGRKMLDDQMTLYTAARNQSFALDGNEGVRPPERESEFVTIREG